MTIKQEVQLVEIILTAHGPVQFKLQKVVKNGDQVLFAEPHRGAVDPGMSASDYLAVVNQHLQSMGFPEISTDGALKPSDILDLVQTYHTPEFIAAYKAQEAARPPLSSGAKHK
jgi:hypothetical protein